MRPSIVLGLLLVLLGTGSLARSCHMESTRPTMTAEPNRASPDAPPTTGVPYRIERHNATASRRWSVLGGLALASGFAIIGIGLGNWRHPRKVRHPADTGPE